MKHKSAPKMAPKPPQNARFQQRAHEELFEAPNAILAKTQNRSETTTKRAIPPQLCMRTCTPVLRMPRLLHPTTMLQNRSKTTAKRAKTPGASRRAHQKYREEGISFLALEPDSAPNVAAKRFFLYLFWSPSFRFFHFLYQWDAISLRSPPRELCSTGPCGSAPRMFEGVFGTLKVGQNYEGSAPASLISIFMAGKWAFALHDCS